MSEVFEALAAQGYEANVGFSGNYQPGNVLRIMEEGPDGKDQSLPTPVVFKWASDCFPGQQPRSAQFLLADSQGSSSASMALGVDEIARVLPSLKLDSKAVSNYQIKFEDMSVRTLAAGDLSGGFSEICVESLSRAIDAGDKPAWFSVVLETIVADGLSMEVEWKSDIDSTTKSSLTETAMNTLSQIATPDATGTQSATVGISMQDQRRTVLSTDRPVIVAYRMRPIQPRYED